MKIILLFFFAPLFLSVEITSSYSYPKPFKKIYDRYEHIAIVGTNDIHGRVVPTLESYGENPTKVKASGLTLLSSYLDALYKEWGNKLLWLDAGDQFQGSLESNLFKGKPIVDFFNFKREIRKASAIGNHEFDFGFDHYSSRMRESNFNRLAANIFKRNSNQIANFPNTSPSKLFKVGRIIVGVIGLTTIQTPFTTAQNVSNLEFKNYSEIVIHESKHLRNSGASIILLTAHVGNTCTKGDFLDLVKLDARTNSTQQKTNCTESDEIYQLLKALPEGTVDGIVGGHLHLLTHHFINGIPVVQGENFARHFNILYFKFDLWKGKLVSNQTVIEGPIAVCEKVPKGETSCYKNNLKKPLAKDTQFENVEFHGYTIKEDLKARNVLKTYIAEAEKYNNKVLATLNNKLYNSAEKESELGNFITNAIQDRTGADFVIYNKGGIRINWETTGNFTYSQLFQTLPFDTFINKVELTGSEIKKMMEIIQNGIKGFYHTFGFRQNVCVSPHKLLSLSLYDGSPIIDDKVYTVALGDFLKNGGDDFKDVVKVVEFKNPVNYEESKVIVEAYMAKVKIIDRPDQTLIDPQRPRLKVHTNCN